MAGHGGRYAAELWEFRMREQARKEEDLSKKTNFTIQFSRAYKTSWAATAVLLLLIGIFDHIVFRDTDIEKLFYFLSVFPFGFFLFSLSYRCTVDEKKMVRVELWIFKKTVTWDRVKYKRIKSINAIENESLTLYDERKKRLIDFVSEQSGFQNMERLVKRKNIPSRHQRIKR